MGLYTGNEFLTYPDANLIINRFSDDIRLVEKAKAILEDPGRAFLVSDFLWIETIPKMAYNKRAGQLQWTTNFFSRSVYVTDNVRIVSKGMELAEKYGLAAMDAFHAGAAIVGGAHELLTFERSEKPFFRIPANELLVISLYEKVPV